MGWSETGTDRMCKLRCFIRNYGREKVIDLVNYRRERELSVAAATGTDGMIDESQRKRYTAKQERGSAICGGTACNSFREFYCTKDPCDQRNRSGISELEKNELRVV